MRIQRLSQAQCRLIIEEVISLRNYISCLHPINQKYLIESFNHYFTTGEVEYDFGRLEEIKQILKNYSVL